jgi:hypothetical protein
MVSISNRPCLLSTILEIYPMVIETADWTQMKELSVHHVLGCRLTCDELFMMQPSTT